MNETCSCYVDEDENELGYTYLMCGPHYQELVDLLSKE